MNTKKRKYTPKSDEKQKYGAEYHRVTCRFTHEQYADLERKALKLEWNVPSLVTKRALNSSKIIEVQPLIHTETKVEIRKIGNNLNQIAKALNSNSYEDGALQLLDEATEIKNHLKSILYKL